MTDTMMRTVTLGAVSGLLALTGCSDDGGSDGDGASSTSSFTATTIDDATTSPTSSPTSDTAGNTEGGVPFIDPTGRFMAVFPNQPQAEPGTATVATGETVEYVLYSADSATGAYFATCVDYSAQGAEIGVDLIAARDAAITNTGGNLFTSEDILVQGRNAIEFTAAFSTSEVDGLMLGRVVADGTALCQVWAIDIADTISDASFEFVESFQFVEEL